LGGQDLDLIESGVGANYTLYGANIPLGFDGQNEELTITALAGSNSADFFDDIQFSSSPISEPSETAMFALGTLSLGFWRWRKSPR
jgi:hypothetical protein